MTLTMSEDIKGLMYCTWLPALMGTMLGEINRLPAIERDRLLRRLCETCEDLAMGGAVGIRPGMGWEEYVKFLHEMSPPIGPWTVSQTNGVYDLVYDCSVDEDGRPRCHCPLVQLEITTPLPQCCESGAALAGRMIGAATSKPVARAEVVGTPLRTGASVCHYRVHLMQ
jgi:hypothetical protein